jgi:hypothetical protein
VKFTICDLLFTRSLQFSKRIMNSRLAFLVLSLLLTSCEKRDSRLRQQVVGTWGKEHGEMILDTKGTFHSQWRGSNKSVDFFGKWEVKNGILLASSTNIDSHGFTNVPPVGRVDSFRIIQVDAARLVLGDKSQTNSYIRK